MQLIFRYDDYCGLTSVPIEHEEAIFTTFLSRNYPVVVGVIPYISNNIEAVGNAVYTQITNDERRVSLLRNLLGNHWQLALHGFTHQKVHPDIRSEFISLPYEEQYKKIISGLEILKDTFPNTPIDVFIPPWNSFDEVTVDVLRDLGFKILSCGREYKYFIQHDITYAPTFLDIRRFERILQLYSFKYFVKLFKNKNVIILMHEYDFSFNGQNNTISLQALARMLDSIRDNDIPVTNIKITDNTGLYIPPYEQVFTSIYKTTVQDIMSPYGHYWMKYTHPRISNILLTGYSRYKSSHRRYKKKIKERLLNTRSSS